MNFIKEIFKKVLIAVVVATVTLVIVYFRDDYLKEDTTDMELLHSTEISKEVKQEEIKPKEQIVVKQQKEEIKKEVVVQKKEEIAAKVEKIEEKVKQKVEEVVENDDALFKPVQEQSFEDFKKQYSMN